MLGSERGQGVQATRPLSGPFPVPSFPTASGTREGMPPVAQHDHTGALAGEALVWGGHGCSARVGVSLAPSRAICSRLTGRRGVSRATRALWDPARPRQGGQSRGQQQGRDSLSLGRRRSPGPGCGNSRNTPRGERGTPSVWDKPRCRGGVGHTQLAKLDPPRKPVRSNWASQDQKGGAQRGGAPVSLTERGKLRPRKGRCFSELPGQ